MDGPVKAGPPPKTAVCRLLEHARVRDTSWGAVRALRPAREMDSSGGGCTSGDSRLSPCGREGAGGARVDSARRTRPCARLCGPTRTHGAHPSRAEGRTWPHRPSTGTFQSCPVALGTRIPSPDTRLTLFITISGGSFQYHCTELGSGRLKFEVERLLLFTAACTRAFAGVTLNVDGQRD